MSDEDDSEIPEGYARALAIAERFLQEAEAEAGELDEYVVLAMLEAAVNRAVDVAGHEDIVAVLRDLADQISRDHSEETAH
ncbi:MAG TPA: hypothetical protein PKY87_07750 [Terricaulis sp.]|nr:hypothetical protein [Terricaulis sp.]